MLNKYGSWETDDYEQEAMESEFCVEREIIHLQNTVSRIEGLLSSLLLQIGGAKL